MQKLAISSGVILSIFIAFYLYAFSLEVSSPISVSTSDGLKLEFDSQSGLINSIISPAGHIESTDSIAESGFFIRDLKSGRKPVHFSGTIKSIGRALVYNAIDDKLGLEVRAKFSGTGKGIDVDIDVTDHTDSDRILTLYFAIPIDLDGWTWGDDIRNSRPIKGNKIMSNTVEVGFGSNGTMSRYPFAAVWNRDGIAIGYPIDHPSVIRMEADPEREQLTISYDFALSRKSKTPCKTHLKAVLYRFNPEWGFRAAAKKYYEIYPEFFRKRIRNEGAWVFTPRYLNRIPDVDDFGFAFHTVSFNPWSLKFEDKHGIYSLQYLTEVWTHYMEIPSTLRDGKYDKVLNYMRHEAKKGNKKAMAALSSGVIDDKNKFVFWVNGPNVKWCPDCVIFTLNPDPDIQDNEYALNKAHFEWYDDNLQIYSNDASKGILDGEMIDSFEVRSEVLDYRDNHIAAADLPLTYSRNVIRPAVPEVFAAYEFSSWIKDKVHALGKLTMANGILQKYAFPAHLFDVMGIEVGLNIIHLGKDKSFNFWRTMSYQKPYCLLYHDDLKEKFTRTFVEEYFQVALFYGMYPGFFGNNGASVIYFKEPRLYERDRDLFKKYMPLIKELGKAGWEPVTYVGSSNPVVFVERYGKGESLYITVRNSSDKEVEYELQIESVDVGLSIKKSGHTVFKDLISGSEFTASTKGTVLRFTDRINGGKVRMLHVL